MPRKGHKVGCQCSVCRMMNGTAKKATSTLIGHAQGAKIATLEQLREIPTPEGTNTWKPIPHVVVPELIDKMVEERGWGFADEQNKYQFTVSKEGARMFGVTKVIIPGVDTGDEFQMAVGFRNSHDKTVALRIAIGTHVLVCDNMMITGDIQVKRIHWNSVDPEEAMIEAFDLIPGAAQQLSAWFGGLREIEMNGSEGVALLASCVEKTALPISSFMDARNSFLEAFRGDSETIQHGKSAWGVYQAVTQQYKQRNIFQLQYYSTRLNEIFSSLN